MALSDVLSALLEVGYDGRVGLEYFPGPGAADPLAAIRDLALDGVEPLAARGARS